MKAIHNYENIQINCKKLFSVCQIYKVWKQFTTRAGELVRRLSLFSVCQIYKVWKQFTTQIRLADAHIRCFQYVKFIKFESNSQRHHSGNLRIACCFQYVKFIKFESNSQPGRKISAMFRCCFQYVKFIKFESNSQPAAKRSAIE